ncbi:MAG: hypothetical protein ACXWCT_14205, partial [Flavitalea sp.]
MKFLIILLTAFLLIGCRESDPGISVAAIQNIDTLKASCPNITKDDKDRFVLSFVRSLNDSTHQFCYAISLDEGKTFGNPIVIPGSSTI